MRSCTASGRVSLATACRNVSSRVCVSRAVGSKAGRRDPRTITRAAQQLSTTTAPNQQTATMAQPFTLYSYPIAFHPAKALLAVEEKGLNVRVQNVDLFNGESLKPWFMKITPESTVPVLVAGDRTLTQTREILAFLDETGTPLGGDQVDRGLVTELVDSLHAWDGNLFVEANIAGGAKGILGSLGVFRERVAQAQMKRAEAAGDTQLASAYKQKLSNMAKGRAVTVDPSAVEANKQELTQLLDRAEGLLGKTPYLAGQAYSMADVVLTAILFRVGLVGQTKQWLGPRPKLSAYYEQVKARPSFKKVFGPPSNPLTSASLILPAVIKAKFASLTGWY